ncbi:MAG: TatD family hydrolase [Desulfofustis sp.]|nr:TatD family hydrolase [Desulfofustis sp.]
MSKARQPIPFICDGACVIDSHCHLDMNDYGTDLDAVIARAVDHGVKGIVTIGIDEDSSAAAIEIARNHRSVRATVGVHPHDAAQASDAVLSRLGELAAGAPDEIVGYGEIGLDYVKQYAPPGIQRSVFRKQLQLAKTLGLPVIIHDREAHQDCLDIIKTEGPFENGGIMHCFSGDIGFARKVIDCNFHISIPGIVTYSKADQMQDVAAFIPDERLLVETDGPFLAPVPFRGRRNEPVYTLYTAQKVAELRQTSLEHVARISTQNACNLFGYRFCC